MNDLKKPSVRLATKEDASILADLGRRTFVETFGGNDYDPEDLQAYLDKSFERAIQEAEIGKPHEELAYYIAEIQGVPIGFLMMGRCDLPLESCDIQAPERRDPVIELKRIYVLQEYQGQGAGSVLMQTAIEYAQAYKIDQMVLGVNDDNQAAQAVYAKYGFEKIGEYKFPVGDHMDTEFIMRKKILFVGAAPKLVINTTPNPNIAPS